MWTLLISPILISLVYGDNIENCPPNLSRNINLKAYNGHCYEFVVHRHIEWKAAESDCASKGGTLVVVNNMEEQLFLMSALGSFSFHGQGVWIGLTDQLQEGKFSWVSGEPATFTYWAAGQPGVITTPHIGKKRLILDTITGLTNIHLIDEDCVLLKYTDSGHWHDYPCLKLDPLGLVHENFPYVCEYRQTATTVGTPQTVTPSTTQTTIPTTTPETDVMASTASAKVAGSVGELVVG
ncbi:C-type lectin domain family 4 member E-like [Crassostrea angulata]|uniref:C-type lectin domain-containing protein n=3 Tax=Magallana gigas TaxID=29159 RepID=K1PQ51_MAGGI|nr:C-type lectin domain family 4 member E [Crassostrea gigas]XP_052716898.1 C-type lectin domain family 4 member E-like [Crassostrea angulata]|eukprot:XP_011437795.1 PREDICTED: C-type lectin domain family 4 member E [Crassostrea gigas]